MANTISSPNMNLPIPVVGVDPGPQWALDIDSCLTLIDSHNHSPGSGVQITPLGLNINADLTFGSNNATNLRSARFTAQSSPLALATDLGCLYESGVDLWYNDGSGNQIRLTQSGSIVGTSGSITGLVSPASASYNAGSSTFIWQSAVNTPANMDAASYILRNLSANSKGLTLEPPNAMGSNYSLVLPSLPAQQNIMTLDASGNITAPWNVDNATLIVSSNQLQVNSQGIQTANIANNAVTQAKMEIRPTGSSTEGTGGLAISSTCGSFSTSSQTPIQITNLSVTLTCLGNPIMISLIPDSSGFPSIFTSQTISNVATQTFSQIIFYVASSEIGRVEVGGHITANTNGSFTVPASSCSVICFPGSGTFTFTAKALTDSTSNVFVQQCQLVAYELK